MEEAASRQGKKEICGGGCFARDKVGKAVGSFTQDTWRVEREVYETKNQLDELESFP